MTELTDDLRRLGLAAGADVKIEPLAGGVSSDIYKVEADGRVFVVKRALAKLRVEADWWAPVERSRYEVAWIEVAGAIDPRSVPKLLAHDDEAGLFAMTYLDPRDNPVWKYELRDGRVDLEFAAEVGRRIGAIHTETAGRADLVARFPTDRNFHAIRLEPYLEATAAKHPAVSDALFALSKRTLATKRALVHGDVSPKNILVSRQGPVFLDAECAWYGDPAFDLAFCLNHLLLKALWNRSVVHDLLEAFRALQEAYFAKVEWEPRAALEARAAALLPGLLLARVDGKSPAEYLTEEADRELVRSVALPLLTRAPERLVEVLQAWRIAVVGGAQA